MIIIIIIIVIIDWIRIGFIFSCVCQTAYALLFFLKAKWKGKGKIQMQETIIKTLYASKICLHRGALTHLLLSRVSLEANFGPHARVSGAFAATTNYCRRYPRAFALFLCLSIWMLRFSALIWGAQASGHTPDVINIPLIRINSVISVLVHSASSFLICFFIKVGHWFSPVRFTSPIICCSLASRMGSRPIYQGREEFSPALPIEPWQLLSVLAVSWIHTMDCTLYPLPTIGSASQMQFYNSSARDKYFWSVAGFRLWDQRQAVAIRDLKFYIY